MIRILNSLAALLFAAAVLAAGPACADATADRRALESLVSAIRTVPGWSVTVGTAPAEGDTAAIASLVIERAGAFTVTVDRLVVVDVATAAGGGVLFGSLTLDGVTLTFGATTATIPRLELKGVALPSFAGWTPDPERPGVSAGALLSLLAQVTFAEARAAEIAIVSRVLAAEAPADGSAATAPGALDQRLRFTNLIARDMRGGALASLTSGRIDSEGVDALGQRVTTQIKSVSLARADLAALAGAFDPAAASPVRDWRSALGELTVEGVDQRGVSATPGAPEPISFMSRFAVKDIAVRRGDRSVGELYDDVFRLAAAPEQTDSALFGAIFPASLSWLKVGALTVERAGVSGGGDEAGEFTFDTLTVKDLSAESLGAAAVDGIGARAGGSFTRVKRIAVERVRWPSADALAAVAAVEEQRASGAIDQPTLERAAENFLAVYPEIGLFALEGLSVTIPGVEPVTVETLSASQTRKDALTDGQSALVKLAIPLALTAFAPDATAALAQLGYRELRFDGDGTVRHDRASGVYDNGGKLTMADGGTLSLSYTLGGVTDAAMRRIAVPFLRGGEDDAANLELSAALDAVTLTGATVRYEDALLVRRLVDWWAQQQGMPVAVVAQTLADAAAEAMRSVDPTLADPAREAVQRFLLNPHSITLRVSPPQPFGLGQLLRLGDGSAAPLPALGVTIEAGE